MLMKCQMNASEPEQMERTNEFHSFPPSGSATGLTAVHEGSGDVWQRPCPSTNVYNAMQNNPPRGWYMLLFLPRHAIVSAEWAYRWMPSKTLRNSGLYGGLGWGDIIKHCTWTNLGPMPWKMWVLSLDLVAMRRENISKCDIRYMDVFNILWD